MSNQTLPYPDASAGSAVKPSKNLAPRGRVAAFADNWLPRLVLSPTADRSMPGPWTVAPPWYSCHEIPSYSGVSLRPVTGCHPVGGLRVIRSHFADSIHPFSF